MKKSAKILWIAFLGGVLFLITFCSYKSYLDEKNIKENSPMLYEMIKYRKTKRLLSDKEIESIAHKYMSIGMSKNDIINICNKNFFVLLRSVNVSQGSVDKHISFDEKLVFSAKEKSNYSLFITVYIKNNVAVEIKSSIGGSWL